LATLMSISTIGLAAYVSGAPQGIPNKVIEYLSADLAVVSSLEGETSELLSSTDSGVTYRSANAADLADHIRLLCADRPRLRELAANARKLFESTFDASVVYPKTATLLECLRAGQGVI